MTCNTFSGIYLNEPTIDTLETARAENKESGNMDTVQAINDDIEKIGDHNEIYEYICVD